MTYKNKLLDFTNQTIYVSIDVHLKHWTIVPRLNGMELKRASIDPSPKVLYKYLNEHYPGANFVTVYEAGFNGYWIHRELEKLGIKNIVVSPLDVPTTNKDKHRKTDSTDASRLAKLLEIGALTALYVPTEEQEALRTLCRFRAQLVKEQTRVKNRIKSLLNQNGIDYIKENMCKKKWTKKFIEHLKGIKFKHQEIRFVLDEQLEILSMYDRKIKNVEKKLKEIVRRNSQLKEIIDELDALPGVGFVAAITFYSEIMDIVRFVNFDKLASYIGLVPSTRSSGEREDRGRVSKRQKTYLRSVLIQAAWRAIKVSPVLISMYNRLISRMKKQQAIIRVAKKLTYWMYRKWKYKDEKTEGKNYEPKLDDRRTNKDRRLKPKKYILSGQYNVCYKVN